MLRRLLATSLAVALLLGLAVSAEAQTTRPFSIAGIGYAPEGLPLPGQEARPHWIVGNATQLGPHFGHGSVVTESAFPVLEEGNPLPTAFVGTFGSGEPFQFKGLRGKLVCDYGRDENGGFTGTFVLTVLDVLPNPDDPNMPFFVVEADFLAEFVPRPDESTGRFAGVTGGWTMHAYTAPFILGSDEPILYGWDGEGELTYPSRRRR